MRRTASVILILLMVAMPFGQTLAWTDPDDSRGPGPLADGSPWWDPLDDTTNVYIPPGGLVGIEVTGGAAQLKAGEDVGWIASASIPCPEGYRYDLVVLEVETPGDSWFNVTILDPSKAPTSDDFANDTVPGYTNLTGTDVSVFRVAIDKYPAIRLQVALHASGTDRPRLLSWGLNFIELGMWKDSFIGTGKMVGHAGIALTPGNLALDLTQNSGGAAEAYPAVLFPDVRGDVDVFYANANKDGYLDGSTIARTTDTYGMDVGDLDGDGNLDLILAMDGSTGSMILWGSDSGKWSTSDSFTLSHSDMGTDAAVGDFDGDGDLDFVISAVGGMMHDGSYVWLNKGDGTFNKNPDIKLDGGTGHVDAGDLNNDGYDDIVLTKSLVMDAPCFFGGPQGPDNTADINFLRGITMTAINQVLIQDVDADGYLDVLFAVLDNRQVPVFLGGKSGPDATADYSLLVNSVAWDVAAGDLDDDGFVDLAYTTCDSGMRNGRIEIFLGSATGWSINEMHTILMGPDPNPIEVIDIDLDGYDDILCGEGSTFKVFYGDSTLPDSEDISKSGLLSPGDMVVASVKGLGQVFKGSIVSEPIPIPDGMVWDLLYMDAVVPGGCDLTVTVLDSTGEVITGLERVDGPVVDLRGVGSWRSIQLQLDLGSTSNTSTPSIRSVMANWHDKMVWRDQFYGDIRAESMLNLGTMNLHLESTRRASSLPELLFACLRSDYGYDVGSKAYIDNGALDYGTLSPMEIATKGAHAVAALDINDDQMMDLVFASYGSAPGTFTGSSPLFLGSPAGWYAVPYHTFSTTGARDVVLTDLNRDGFADVVFAQERDWSGANVKSALYWGSASGWNSTPDVVFDTDGASGVEAVDLDEDGWDDLAFACYGIASVHTNSMVFYQESAGFCGTTPDHTLATVGARDVAWGDIDGDGNKDLVFANSYDGDSYLTSSYVYWGQAGRGFKGNPLELDTEGAVDVEVADLDNDLDLDVVFANNRNSTGGYMTMAGIYMNEGGGDLRPLMMNTVMTDGAYAVAVVDLDGSGVQDLVFACRNNGTGHDIPSVVYASPWGMWPFMPTLEIPTVGAVDVLPVSLASPDRGGYLSEAITPDPDDDVGYYHTLSFEAMLGNRQTGTVSILDAVTGEVLASTPVVNGHSEWFLKDMVNYRAHPSIRIQVSVGDLVRNPGFMVDDLWLNWTKRVPMAPQVIDAGLSDTQVLRASSVSLTVTVSDEFDDLADLNLKVEHQLVGGTEWRSFLVSSKVFEDGAWNVTITPDRFVELGEYRFRVNVTDSDGLFSGQFDVPGTLEVLPNISQAPRLLSAVAGNGAVSLEWRAPLETGDLPLDGYKVLRGTTEVDLVVIDDVDVFTEDFTDDGLTNGVTYYYALVAYNDLGNSPMSQVLNATPLGVPGLPMNLSATPGDGQVSLSWDPPMLDGGTPVLGYRLFRATSGGPLEELEVLEVVTEYLDEGLTNGLEYSYALMAFNSLGNGLRTEAVQAVPVGLPGIPGGLTVEAGVMTMTISWQSPVETGGVSLSGFVIYRGTSEDDLTVLESMPASVLTYVDDDLVAGDTYYYAVAAENSAGTGLPCTAVSAVAVNVPGAPGDLVAVAGDGQVVLTWTSPFDGGSVITGYIVKRTNGGSTQSFDLGVVTTYTDTTVSNGVTYSYTVQAKNALGPGPLSTSVEASPAKELFVPGEVASLTVTAKGGKVTLTWAPPADDGGSSLTGYVILRGDSADSMTELVTLGLVTAHVDDGVKEGHTYYYTVVAVNAVGHGASIDPVMVKVQKVQADEDEFPTLLMAGIVVVLAAIVLAWVVMPRLRKEA